MNPTARVLQYAAVAIAAAATFAIVTVEVAGTLGGLIAGGDPVLIGPAAAIATAWSIVSELSTVSRGDWPAHVREGLPAREQLRPLVLLGAALGAAVLFGVLAFTRTVRSEQRGRQDRAAAKMAGRRDLRKLFVWRPGGDRVVLGRFGGRLVAAEDKASVLVVAPPQTHKTTGLVVPALLEWRGALIGVSVKSDLLDDTLAARRKIGEVKVFDPMGSTGAASDNWSPVLQACSWTHARAIAAGLLQIDVAGGAHQSQDKAFWRPAAQGYLAALIFAAHLGGGSMADVSRWIDASSPGDLKGARNPLRKAKDDEHSSGDRQREAADALVQIDRIWDEEFDPRTRSSLVLTLSTALYAWGEPSVQDATAAAGEESITPDWLLDGSNTLYLVAPSKDQQRLQGLFTALIQSVVDEAFSRSSRNGSKAIDPRLLLVIDEAANTAPLPSLDAIASSGPGQGVTTLTVLQTLSQATHAWGADKAQSIIGSHRAKVFGAGISDTETHRYLDAILGEQATPRTSVSKDRGKLIELGSKTESIEHRKLQGPHQVREAKEGTALLIYGNLRPGRIALRPWFKDRRLTRLRNDEAPTTTIALQVARRQITRSTTGDGKGRGAGGRHVEVVRGSVGVCRGQRAVGSGDGFQFAAGAGVDDDLDVVGLMAADMRQLAEQRFRCRRRPRRLVKLGGDVVARWRLGDIEQLPVRELELVVVATPSARKEVVGSLIDRERGGMQRVDAYLLLA